MAAKKTRTNKKNMTREELAERYRKKQERKLRLDTKRKKVIAIVLAVLIVLFIFYGRPILKLRMENNELKKQNEELTKEKSATEKQLKNVHSKDFIKEQARKQLRLLDKDEKIFLFEEEETEDAAD